MITRGSITVAPQESFGSRNVSRYSLAVAPQESLGSRNGSSPSFALCVRTAVEKNKMCCIAVSRCLQFLTLIYRLVSSSSGVVF